MRPNVVLTRVVASLLVSLITAYLLLCALMFAAQKRLLYHPPHFTRQQIDEMASTVGLRRWTNAAGEPIGLMRLSPKHAPVGSVLIAYGNGSSAIHCAHYAHDIQSAAALDIFILEYPGYADRPGAPNQKTIFAAAEEAIRDIPTDKPIYLVGESLGSGVVSFLAGTHPNRIAGVLLISPFDNLASPAQYQYPFLPVRLLLTQRFSSDVFLRSYHGRLGVVVDGKDNVVPERFGRRLYDHYGGPKKLWSFPNAGHCQISEPQPRFWKEVLSFWQT